MGCISTTEKGSENRIKTGKSDLKTIHKQLELQDAATSKAMDSLQDHGQSRLIPIEQLKSGEFYDIQSKDPSPRVLGALLLEQLPHNRAKLMFLSFTDFDRFTALDTEIVLGWKTLQIETIELITVYPYQTFTHQPTMILQWPGHYGGEELIFQISEEMRRTVKEGRWIFNLPHFLEGYLHIYLSYIRNRDNYLRRMDLIDLWFDFMGSYFSVLRDHILRVKLLSRDEISYLLKAMKGMDQMSQKSWQLNYIMPNFSSIEKEMKVKNIKNSFFDSYRPIELSLGVFNQFWKCILKEYLQDLTTWQLQEPLRLGDLLVNSPKLTQIINRHQYFAKDLMYFAFPELHPEESLRLKLRIAAATDSFDLAEALFTQSGVSLHEICLIILEEKLLDSILRSSSERMKIFVITRIEFFPLLLAYSNSTDIPGIDILCAFQSLIARIALADWEFVSFAIKQNIVANVYRYLDKNPELTYTLIQRLLEVCLQHKMCPELLRNLLPCVDYGHLVFPAFVEMFSRLHCREVMLFYFRSGHYHTDVKSSKEKDRLLSFWKFLTARIAIEDWELVTILVQNITFSLKDCHSLDDQMCNDVKNLANVALEHNMSAELLKDLFPCNSYGHIVLATLIEKPSIPHSRLVMLSYFTREFSLAHIKNYWDKDRFCVFLRFLTIKIRLEDWEILTFMHRFTTFTVATQRSFINDQKMYEHVADLVKMALEHKMSGKLLIDLLPCEGYGHLVFPALVEGSSFPHSRVMMLTYFKSEISLTRINYYWNEDKFCKFLKVLAARVAAEDWEILTFVNRFQTFTAPMLLSLVNDQQVYKAVKVFVRVALEHNMSGQLLRNLLPYKNYGHHVLETFAKGFSRARSFRMMISYYGSELQCIEFARGMVKSRKRGKKDIDKRIAQYLQSENVDLWYVFGGSVQIQFIWVRQFSRRLIKRLSLGLIREVCSYLA